MEDKNKRICRFVTESACVAFVMLLVSVLSASAHANNTSNAYPPHQVKAGETLYRISTTRGFTVDEVAKFNRIKPPYTLSIGQVLRFPAKSQGAVDVQPTTIEKPRPVRRERSHSGATAVQQRTQPQPTRNVQSTAPVETVQNTVDTTTPKVIVSKPTVVPATTNAQTRAQDGWQWPVNAKPIQDFGVSKRGYSYVLDDKTDIVAATSGKVIYAKQGLGSYRHIVITTTPEGFVVAYEFNSDIKVEENTQIEKGQVIATIDKSESPVTPRADAYGKFYFEVWRNGATINPEDMMVR